MNLRKRVNGSWTDIPYYLHNTSSDTITTLPADIYANAATATVGLKGQTAQSGTPSPQNPVMPNGFGERTANLIYIEDISETVTVIYKDKFLMQSISEGTYTLSFNTTANVSHMVSVGVGATGYSKDIKTISGVQNGYYTMDFTISAEDSGKNLYVRFVRFGAVTTVTYTVTNIMLNTGSTALPYEPYGVKIPISSANTTTPVYLGEVESTRKIKKLVLTGEENITQHSVQNDIIGVRIPTPSSVLGASIVICSHYEGVLWPVYNGYRRYGIVASNPSSGNAIVYMSAPDSEHNTLSTFVQWIKDQHAAGTPVTVWYVLATEETAVVNEPLMKIGDYADEVANISIPVTAGGDTLSVGTTVQPSEITANYKGWHPVADIHERDNGAWT